MGNVGEVEAREEALLEASPDLEEERCRHYWLIESPQGATSQGVCKICGAVRQFRNSFADIYWDGDVVSDLGRWSRRSSSLSVGLDDEDELSVAPAGELALSL